MSYLFCVFILIVFHVNVKNVISSEINDVPPSHLKYINRNVLHNQNDKFCWGYEPNCVKNKSFFKVNCTGDHIGFVKSKETQIDTFWTQADFGFVKQQINELSVMCEPFFPNDSSLECSKYLRFCRGRNIMLNFTDLINRKEPIRYKMDVFSQGQIGGFCELHEARLKKELEHVSPLQSWAPELRFFEKLNRRPIEHKDCEIVIEKPTILMKIDATLNMYHHFCDFFNLYASLHVNMTYPLDRDNQILVWETYDYNSPFKDTFDVFTKNPILDLKTYRGKTVCFKNLMLPLLPRMIFGLYYNTPLVNGCGNSGLFHAFSEQVLHRLAVPLYSRVGSSKIRITIISRKTKFRQILNELELIEEIQKNENYVVKSIVFERNLKFKDQLEIIRNTDVLIGMHGAGLTHLLFLPNWASIFEIYNCEDPTCYMDLARLRGINYLTWENSEKLIQEDEGHHPDHEGGHPKFTNFSFDKTEFTRLVTKAVEHVEAHEEFKQFVGSTSTTVHNEL